MVLREQRIGEFSCQGSDAERRRRSNSSAFGKTRGWILRSDWLAESLRWAEGGKMPAKQVVISVNSEHKCEEEVKLLDACLAALSEEESTKKAARLRAATTSEVAVAHAQLITARDRYW